MVAVGRLLEPLRHPALDLLGPHQAPDALFADGFAVLPQVLPQPGPSVAIATGCMEGAELRPQHQVSLRPRRQSTSCPGVEPTASDPHTTAEDGDTVLGLLCRDEDKPHRLCFAKNAVAFFRMSRSSSA